MQIPAVGDVLAGKYAVEGIVGRGGMGVVFAARHLELDERVAIKLILADEGPNGGEFVARFLREAKLASKIKSEHVVRVIDVARLETGAPYIVMELLEGQDLAELLARGGPFPVERAALFVLQACEALAEAHALGIVHRDLKPANLFLTTRRDGRPCVKVLDFGISKLVGAEPAQSMTKTSALMGSPLYMSPDQLIQARDVDARSDIWAMGVTLFELLTGRHPFQAEEAPQLIAQILHAPAPALRSLVPGAPLGLEAVVSGALVKDRNQRTQDITAFAAGLAPYAGDIGRYSVERISGLLERSSRLSGSALTSSGQWSPSSQTPSGTASATSGGSSLDLRTTRRPSRALPALLLLGVLVAAGGVASWWLLLRAPPAQPAADAPDDAAVAASSASLGVAAPAPAAPAPVPPSTAASEFPAAAPPVAVRLPPVPVKRRPQKPGLAPARPPTPAESAAAPAAADPFGGVR
jgi:serine/threonine protein kinase